MREQNENWEREFSNWDYWMLGITCRAAKWLWFHQNYDLIIFDTLNCVSTLIITLISLAALYLNRFKYSHNLFIKFMSMIQWNIEIHFLSNFFRNSHKKSSFMIFYMFLFLPLSNKQTKNINNNNKQQILTQY